MPDAHSHRSITRHRKKMLFILDMDNTIVGNLRYLVNKYRIVSLFVEKGLAGDELYTQVAPWMSEAVRSLVRPHFQEFMSWARRKGHDVALFTSSDNDWATYIVPIIESVVGAKFGALFTRDQCMLGSDGKYIKSLAKILPQLESDLKRTVDRSSIYIIDNGYIWVGSDMDRVTLCPSYTYIEFSDPFGGIDPRLFTIGVDAVASFLLGRKMPKPMTAAHYEWCLSEIKKVSHENAWMQPDEFWLKFRLCGTRKCRPFSEVVPL